MGIGEASMVEASSRKRDWIRRRFQKRKTRQSRREDRSLRHGLKNRWDDRAFLDLASRGDALSIDARNFIDMMEANRQTPERQAQQAGWHGADDYFFQGLKRLNHTLDKYTQASTPAKMDQGAFHRIAPGLLIS
jgi:hypothetical protein